MIRVILRLLLLSLAIAAGPGAARAQSCSFSMTDINFGLMDPPATTTSPYATTTGTFAATCTGDAGETVNVCAKLGEGSGGIGPATPATLTADQQHRFHDVQWRHGCQC